MRFALLIGLLVVGPAFALEDEDTRKEKFKEIVSEYITKQKAAAQMGRRINPSQYVGQVLKLIEENPKDDLAFSMLDFAVRGLQSSHPAINKALVDFHLENPKIGQLCLSFAFRPNSAGLDLAETVSKKHPKEETRNIALFALAVGSHRMWEQSTSHDPKEKAKIVALYKKIQEELADEKIGGTTMGRYAKGSLFEFERLQVGQVAPEASCEDVEGNKVKLSDYRGKVVVLDFWATWCGPCRAMIPHEREMVERLKDEKFVFVSISADTKKETLTNFIEKTPMPWTHWWCGTKGGIVEDWNIHAFPTMYVLDSKGVIRYKNVRGDALDQAVDNLLKDSK